MTPTASLNGIIGGWQVQGVYTFQSGFPLRFGTDGFYNGGAIAISDPTVQKWFNTDAFTSILTGTAANATPINHLRSSEFPFQFDDVRGDTINSVDLSLIKDITFKNDVRLQLRAEFTNALNQAYIATGNGQIVANPQSATFGQISASNQQNYARRAQIGVKILF